MTSISLSVLNSVKVAQTCHTRIVNRNSLCRFLVVTALPRADPGSGLMLVAWDAGLCKLSDLQDNGGGAGAGTVMAGAPNMANALSSGTKNNTHG